MNVEIQPASLSGLPQARARGMVAYLRATWAQWSLARQFAVGATLILLPAMMVTGLWVQSRIKQGALAQSAVSAALFLENFVEPLVQELAYSNELSKDNFDKLSRLLKETSLSQQVVSMKIWKKENTVVYATLGDVIGKSFPATPGLQSAWRGKVQAELDHLHDDENTLERETGLSLVEIYLPLRERGSERIIAVAEFYERADSLQAELFQSNLQSWLVVSGVTLSMLGSLFHIVRRGSTTIAAQKKNLEERVGDLTRLLAENQELRSRVQRATLRASESNEIYLRRLGADLHDGPAQLVSLALLRLDSETATPQVKSVLTDALKDIRNIAAGLAVPEIDSLTLEDAINNAVLRHEKLTGTKVAIQFQPLPASIPHAIKLCAYRVVQEGLSNAFRHADGKGQAVRAAASNSMLTLEIQDAGNGVQQESPSRSPGGGQGLKGLTDRVESLGGTLTVAAINGSGTQLHVDIPLHYEVHTHA